MTSSRHVSLVHAIVLLAFTASACTFFYVLTLVWEDDAPRPNVSSPPVVQNPDSPATSWQVSEDFESMGQVVLPDEFAPPELYLPQDDDAQRFALRHPDYVTSGTRLPIFEVILGGPGMYPPVRLLSDEAGEFETSLEIADLLDGEQVESLEVFIREKGRGRHAPLGLWQELEVDGLKEGSCAHGVRCKIISLWDVIPLSVEVRNASGERLTSASVKLSLKSVGLVHLKEQVNSGGDVFFGGVPQGNYTLSIKAPGYLREEFEISHVSHYVGSDDSEDSDEIVRHEVILEEGRSLYGRVVDARGEGVVDAFVTIYVDRYGSPDVLSVESFSRIDSVPVRGIATTVEGGYFSVSGLPKGVAYVTAMGMLGVPALSEPLDLRELAEVGPVEVVLHDGSDVEVLVASPDGPIGGVVVSWRDAQTGLRASFTTAKDGVAIFEDVPPQAMFTASIDRWSARGRGLEAPDEDGVYRLELELEPPGLREDIRLRLLTPLKNPVKIIAMSFRAEQGGEVCEARKVERRDWMFERCKPQKGWFEVHTDARGTWSSLIDLDHGIIVTMPEPLEVSVFWRGWQPPPERMMIEDVVGERERGVSLTVLDRRAAHRTWAGHLYPGRYNLKVTTAGKRHEKVFMVQEEVRSIEWESSVDHTLRVDLVDDRSHPLRKSYFAVIREGRHADVRRDNASHIVPLSSKDVGKVTLLACGSASGCVTHLITAQDMSRDRLLLDTPGTTLTGASSLGGISGIDALSALLGTALVRDNLRVLADVKDTESVAAKLGVPRGAELVFVGTHDTSKGKQIEALMLLADGTWKHVSGPGAR